MGNSPFGAGRAPVATFYSADAWIEGGAIDQLEKVAKIEDVTAVAAMPDLHPGKYGPVGCAILADRIHPEFVGSDIGCGMSLFALDGPARKLRLDKAANRLRVLGAPWDGDGVRRLQDAGLVEAGFASALGTIGGGNHFCEIQVVADVLDGKSLVSAGLHAESLCMLVHSGSRGLGNMILEEMLCDGLVSLEPESEAGRAYRARHDLAVRWASLNRRIIAERAARALRMEHVLIVDAPHNLLEDYQGRILHRKGAATVTGSPDGLVPIAGSRETLSYLVRWSGKASAMQTLAHGAGRKYDRASARHRGRKSRSDLARLGRNPFGGYVICEDKNLMVEEAADAYKDCSKVVADLEAHGLAKRVASLKPLVTFKVTRPPGNAEKPHGRHRGRDRAGGRP